MKHESDRGCVIFGAALISEALEELLRAHFRHTPDDAKLINSLFQGYAPLAIFSAKFQLAYAFGVLPRELYQVIELIRRLRNEFAHESGPLCFDDPQCASRLELLFKLYKEMRSSKKDVDERKRGNSDQPLVEANICSKRNSFIEVLAYVLGFLHALAVMVKAGLDVREKGKA